MRLNHIGTVIAAMLSTSPVVADTPPRDQLNPASYGHVSQAPLADLADGGLRNACQLLAAEKLGAAAREFELAAARNPDNLVAFVGRLQCLPDGAAFERKRWATDQTAAGRFRLAVALFTEWRAQPRRLFTGDLGPVRRARDLLEASWGQLKEPIVGLMLIEVNHLAPRTPDTVPQTVRTDLIGLLAGPRAFALYRKAARSGWRDRPPDASLTPARDAAPLAAVLKDAWSSATARARYTTLVNGRETWGPWSRPSAEQARRLKYLDQWICELQPH